MLLELLITRELGNYEGHARIFDWDGSAWVQFDQDIDGEASGDLFGYDVATNDPGDIIMVSGNRNDGAGSNAGHVRAYQNNACTAPVSVTILPGEDASFSYFDSVYCLNNVDPTPTISGTTGGLFSSSNGLVIDSITGYINLNNSALGSYVVTYITSTSDCADTAIFPIEIIPSFIGDTLVQAVCDTFEWNGITYDSTGLYSDTLLASSGCDSIIYLDLSVLNLALGDTTFLTSCDTVSWNGNDYSISGIYTDTLTSSIGCDSIAILDLTVNQYFYTIDSIGICTGDSAMLAGAYQTTSGVYYDTLQTTAGCDSIVETHLTVDSVIYSYDSLSICSGDSALIAGNYESTAGIYRDTLTAQAGCDSVAVMELTIIPTLANTIDSIGICTGDSAMLAGVYQTTSGVYYDTLQTAAGCDSIVETHLTVDSVIYSYDSLSICSGDSALIAGNYESTAGTYRDTLTAQAGCDSIAVMELTIIPSLANTIDSIGICTGDSAMLAGAYQTTSGVYYDTLQTAAGCDSIVETHLTVDSVIYSYDSLSICSGDSALIAGNYESTAGTYRDTLTAQAGCDSIAVMELTIIPALANTIDSIGICTGDSAMLAGAYQTTSGVYYDTLQTAAGCDSIVETHLTVDSVIYSYDSLSICSGDSALIAGNYESTGGTYRDTLTAQAGCDSVAVMELTIIPALANTIDSIGICTGDSAMLAGAYQTTSGVYYDTLQTSAGCDSIVETHLTVDNVIYSYDSLSICSGDSALIAGNYESTSGTYRDTLTAQAGCDSVAVMELTIIPTLANTIDSIGICTGDSAMLAGAYQTTSGVYYDTLQTAAGCDSIVETHLTVDSVIYSYDSLSICSGDSALIAGNYESTSGTYRDTLTAQAGCDSVAVMELTIIPTLANTIDSIGICTGDSAMLAGVYQTTSGVYYDTLQTAAGCDSIVETHLTVDNVIYSYDSLSICSGDSALIAGNYESTSGTYRDTLTAQAGCDSVAVMELTIIPTLANTIDSIGICTGDSAMLAGVYQTTSGVYYDTLQTAAGCDSIVETHLTVDNVIYSYDSLSICSGDSALIAGNYESTSGTYRDTLTAQAGCDSIAVMELTIIPTLANTIDSIGICTGDSAMLAGAYQTTSGVYYDTLQTAAGCDSIVETHLTVDNVIYSYDSLSICSGDSALIAGNYESTSGTYRDTLTAQAGCDSVAVMELTIIPTLANTIDSIGICTGDSAMLAGVYQTTSGVYYDTLQTTAGCDSIVETHLTVDNVIYSYDSLSICSGDSALIAGNYESTSGTYRDTLTAQAGCDSVAVMELTIIPTLANTIDSIGICTGDSAMLAGVYQTTSGVYYDTLQTAAGCDSIVETHLTVDNVIYSYDSLSICSGDSALIAGNYESTSGTYRDTLTAQAGCDSVAVMELTIIPTLANTIDSL